MAQVQINLLTKELREDSASALTSYLIWAGFVVLLALVGIGVWQFIDYQQITSDVASSDTELTLSKKQVEAVRDVQSLQEGIKQAEALIHRVRGSKPPVNDILAEVQSKTPSDVSITSFSLTGDGINLAVESRTFVAVEKFIDSLRTQKAFANVKLISLSQENGKPVQATLSTAGKGGQGR